MLWMILCFYAPIDVFVALKTYKLGTTAHSHVIFIPVCVCRWVLVCVCLYHDLLMCHINKGF